ncbi:hypothetical protein [Brevundimonas sp.]|uniref:hypothetical protein n=1 Tax=Brevundimonas sp. TaxID=1871086 RepID=UPI0025C605B1|nr:hypothetical protein [Brevundimonas sp.]
MPAYGRVGQYARTESLRIEAHGVLINLEKGLNRSGGDHVCMDVVSSLCVSRECPGAQASVIVQPGQRFEPKLNDESEERRVVPFIALFEKPEKAERAPFERPALILR